MNLKWLRNYGFRLYNLNQFLMYKAIDNTLIVGAETKHTFIPLNILFITN